MELINEPTQSLSSKAQGVESIRNGMSDFTKETAIGPFKSKSLKIYVLNRFLKYTVIFKM